VDHQFDPLRVDGNDVTVEAATCSCAAPARVSLARRPVSIRLSPREFQSVTAAAEACGRAPSVFVRNAALSAAGRPLPPAAMRRDALARETARAVGQLGKIGSLLNQIARVANSTGRLASTDAAYAYEHVARELAAIRQVLIEQDGHGRE